MNKIEIDFENTFEFVEYGENLSFVTFYSPLNNGQKELLKVKIKPLNDPLLPNVYNLSFGPIIEFGGVDDKIQLNHVNSNKVFSTILLYALSYIEIFPNVTIGVDGSNDVRAYLYHRMFHTNREYLSDFFITIGVDWYVKLLRHGNDVERDNLGIPVFKPKPEPFDYERKSTDLYRYYMFHGKNLK